MTNYSPNLPLAKKLNRWAGIISAAVILIVVSLRQIPKMDLGIDFSFLPPFYSAMNAVTAILLILALVAIKKKQIEKHKKIMMSALACSLVFLLCYVIYHLTSDETLFCKEGKVIRFIYFFILMTHILLAAFSLPFILFTFIRGFTFQIEKHRKMARWVYPIWLYVAITGPVIYAMLYPCYSH